MNNYFTLNEMCCSGSYPRLVEIPKEGSKEYNNIMNLIQNLLNPIREKLGGPITVTSGYRPVALNKAVGGAPNSNHLYGFAADIHFKNNSTDNVKIIEALLSLNIPYDECIAEKSLFNKSGELVSASWIHVALRPEHNRKKLLYTSDMKHYYPLKFSTKIMK